MRTYFKTRFIITAILSSAIIIWGFYSFFTAGPSQVSNTLFAIGGISTIVNYFTLLVRKRIDSK